MASRRYRERDVLDMGGGSCLCVAVAAWLVRSAVGKLYKYSPELTTAARTSTWAVLGVRTRAFAVQDSLGQTASPPDYICKKNLCAARAGVRGR